MNLETECQAIEKGMQLERDGREFYLKAAERTQNNKGREMFRSLADDELRHLQTLERQLAAIRSNDRCEALPGMGNVSADWDVPLYPKDPGLFQKAVRPETGDLDALLFAIQAENASYEHYRRMAKESSDSAARDMYRWLASAERGHFNQLMLNYDSLANSGYWAE